MKIKKVIKTVFKILLFFIVVHLTICFIVTFSHLNRSKSLNTYYFQNNIVRIHKAITAYADNTHFMPQQNRWYDDILGNCEYIMIGDFRSWRSYTDFEISLNQNLSGKDVNTIKPNIVLLFSGRGSKNIAGSTNMLEKHIATYNYGWIITFDGNLYLYDIKQKIFINSKDKNDFKQLQDFVWDL